MQTEIKLLFNHSPSTMPIYAASGSELPSVAASSRLASAFCGVYDAYKESGMVPNDSLQSPPSGVPLLAAPCDTFVRHCVKSRKITFPNVHKSFTLPHVCLKNARNGRSGKDPNAKVRRSRESSADKTHQQVMPHGMST